MPSPISSRLDRRTFLAGAGAAVLAACSGGSNKGPGPTTSSSRPAFNLLSFSDPTAVVAGSPVRLTFGVADADGVVLAAPPGPTSLAITIQSNGTTIGAPVQAVAHSAGLPRAYYPVTFTPPTAGNFDFTAQVAGTPVSTVLPIPSSTQVVSAGQPMPVIDTPTVANPLGVQLLCTRDPQCPLHAVSLKQALASHQRVALLFATPKYCQVAICGPVLDVLLSVTSEFPSITFIHCEVYPSDAAAQPGAQQLTDAMNTFGLTFEPCLYLAGPDGVISRRLDTIFDQTELREALTQLAG